MPSFFTTFVAGVPVGAGQETGPSDQVALRRARRVALAAGACMAGLIAARLGWGPQHVLAGGMIGLAVGLLPWCRGLLHR